MSNEQRLIARFDAEFQKGLANVKFFVKSGRQSVADLIKEINEFEDTSASLADTRFVETIDKACQKIRFDAEFDSI
jgi:hypothetical protein